MGKFDDFDLFLPGGRGVIRMPDQDRWNLTGDVKKADKLRGVALQLKSGMIAVNAKGTEQTSATRNFDDGSTITIKKNHNFYELSIYCPTVTVPSSTENRQTEEDQEPEQKEEQPTVVNPIFVFMVEKPFESLNNWFSSDSGNNGAFTPFNDDFKYYDNMRPSFRTIEGSLPVTPKYEDRFEKVYVLIDGTTPRVISEEIAQITHCTTDPWDVCLWRKWFVAVNGTSLCDQSKKITVGHHSLEPRFQVTIKLSSTFYLTVFKTTVGFGWLSMNAGGVIGSGFVPRNPIEVSLVPGGVAGSPWFGFIFPMGGNFGTDTAYDSTVSSSGVVANILEIRRYFNDGILYEWSDFYQVILYGDGGLPPDPTDDFEATWGVLFDRSIHYEDDDSLNLKRHVKCMYYDESKPPNELYPRNYNSFVRLGPLFPYDDPITDTNKGFGIGYPDDGESLLQFRMLCPSPPAEYTSDDVVDLSSGYETCVLSEESTESINVIDNPSVMSLSSPRFVELDAILPGACNVKIESSGDNSLITVEGGNGIPESISGSFLTWENLNEGVRGKFKIELSGDTVSSAELDDEESDIVSDTRTSDSLTVAVGREFWNRSSLYVEIPDSNEFLHTYSMNLDYGNSVEYGYSGSFSSSTKVGDVKIDMSKVFDGVENWQRVYAPFQLLEKPNVGE